MTNTEPDVKDLGRYTIGEAAKLLQIDRTTLLRHTNQGLIRCNVNKRNFRKSYSGSEIKRYWRNYW
jgi:predicted site-specific integrase-resolvase